MDFPAPREAQKACSGACMGDACSGATRVWILAACDGMITIFQKNPDGCLSPLLQGNNAISPSVETFYHYLDEAAQTRQFTQLILVGSTSDIAWVQRALPESAIGCTSAEIQYPLVSGWFRETPHLKQLSQALEQLFRA